MSEMESDNATGRVDWETPPELFKQWDDIYHFTADVCADEFNHKVKRYYDQKQDGLAQDWSKEIAWCNPPYGRGVIDPWVAKAWESAQRGATVVMLLPARTSVGWFHKYIYKQPNVECHFLEGRLKFVGADNSAMFASMIVVFKPAQDDLA